MQPKSSSHAKIISGIPDDQKIENPSETYNKLVKKYEELSIPGSFVKIKEHEQLAKQLEDIYASKKTPDSYKAHVAWLLGKIYGYLNSNSPYVERKGVVTSEPIEKGIKFYSEFIELCKKRDEWKDVWLSEEMSLNLPHAHYMVAHLYHYKIDPSDLLSPGGGGYKNRTTPELNKCLDYCKKAELALLDALNESKKLLPGDEGGSEAFQQKCKNKLSDIQHEIAKFQHYIGEREKQTSSPGETPKLEL